MRARLLVLLFYTVALFAQAPNPASTLGGYRIAGVVYDAATGQTLPGARVSLGSTAGGHVPDRSDLTGPDGSFEFDHLRADKYQMYAEAVGFPLQGFEQHEPPFLTGVVVGPGISADHLAFRLQRGSSISGFVTDEFNEPVRDAQVLLFRRGLAEGEVTTHFAGSAETDDRGYYKFAPLMRGTYFVAVSAHPWYARSVADLPQQQQSLMSSQATEDMKRLDTAYPLTFYSGATNPADATGIPVRSGERVSADIGLQSVPAVTIRMHNTVSNGHRVPFIRLSKEVLGDYELPVNVQQHAERTDMVFTGIAPGHYLAHVSVPGEEADRIQDIDISGDMTLDPDTFFTAGSCSIKGVVQMATGGPPPTRRVAVYLRNRSGGPSQGRNIDAKGMFSFDGVQPGTYEVSIGSPSDLYLQEMAASSAKINGRLLTIGGASSIDLAIILGKGMGEIYGTAKLNGKGLGGTMVVLVPANAGANSVLFRRDQSDSDGTFTLSRIVPGRYTVLSIEDGFDLEWSRPDVLKPYLAKGTLVEVAADGKYDIEVEVQPK
jgi:hypothetical protein